MTQKATVICAQCHRIVYTTDVNTDGHCVLCARPTDAPAPIPETDEK